jgi:hypothetical protein
MPKALEKPLKQPWYGKKSTVTRFISSLQRKESEKEEDLHKTDSGIDWREHEEDYLTISVLPKVFEQYQNRAVC